MNDDELADIIVEVFDGVTVLDSSFGPIYIRHFHNLESRKILAKKKPYLNEAKKRGLMSEEESLNYLFEEGMWDEKSEDEIQQRKKYIENLKESLVKIQLPSQRESHKEVIKKEEEELIALSHERESLIGLTAEKYVEKKVNKEFFESILFLDKDFKTSIFDELDYQDLNQTKEISYLEGKFFERMSDKNISTAVLSAFFSPYLAYAEDVLGLFGKPLKDLSAFQLRMITYARSFLNIFKNTQKDVPEYIAKDPELLVEFFEAQKNEGNQRKNKGSEGSGGSTYFGANEEDIQSIKASDETAVTLSEEIKKKGGKLDMQQMMELHGL